MRSILSRAEFTATVGPRGDLLPGGGYVSPHVYLLDVKDAQGERIADCHLVSRRASAWESLKSGDLIKFSAGTYCLSRPRNFRLVTPRDESDLRGPADRAAQARRLVWGHMA
jgi:hypothetical protein